MFSYINPPIFTNKVLRSEYFTSAAVQAWKFKGLIKVQIMQLNNLISFFLSQFEILIRWNN